MDREQAMKLYESKFWEELTPRQIAEFQLAEDRPCVPFAVFRGAVEETLGRPVFTHEFRLNRAGLISEVLGDRPGPSLEDVMNLIPECRRLVIFA